MRKVLLFAALCTLFLALHSPPTFASGYTAVCGQPGTTAEANCIKPTSSGGVSVGGKTVEVCVTPTVTTANAYGTNYVVGGLLTFANAFTATGSGILQSVDVTIAHVETSGFTFTPFISNPSNTTWTDASVAGINSADVAKTRGPVNLSQSSVLGTHTIMYGYGLGAALSPVTTSLFGVLTANAALTNNFTSASEVQVCVTVLQDL